MRRGLLSVGAVAAVLAVAGASPSAYASSVRVPVAATPSPSRAKSPAPSSPSPAPATFTTALKGGNETPPNKSPATGTAKITVNTSSDQVCWNLTAQKLQGSVTGAHIHRGPAGKAGPIVLGLTPPTGGSSHGCKKAGPPLVRGIVKNPANYYVNVHSSKYPDGEIRGQL